MLKRWERWGLRRLLKIIELIINFWFWSINQWNASTIQVPQCLARRQRRAGQRLVGLKVTWHIRLLSETTEAFLLKRPLRHPASLLPGLHIPAEPDTQHSLTNSCSHLAPSPTPVSPSLLHPINFSVARGVFGRRRCGVKKVPVHFVGPGANGGVQPWSHKHRFYYREVPAVKIRRV